jgi:thymidylate kinase
MIVIFEGPDGAGKDTLRKAFEKANNYKHTCVTRFFLSQLVYAWYYQRPLYTDPKKWRTYCRLVKKFVDTFDAVFVLVIASPNILIERISARGENPAEGPDAIEAIRMFRTLINIIGIEDRTIIINTSAASIDLCRKVLQEKIELLEKENENGRTEDGGERTPKKDGRSKKGDGDIAGFKR